MINRLRWRRRLLICLCLSRLFLRFSILHSFVLNLICDINTNSIWIGIDIWIQYLSTCRIHCVLRSRGILLSIMSICISCIVLRRLFIGRIRWIIACETISIIMCLHSRICSLNLLLRRKLILLEGILSIIIHLIPIIIIVTRIYCVIVIFISPSITSKLSTLIITIKSSLAGLTWVEWLIYILTIVVIAVITIILLLIVLSTGLILFRLIKLVLIYVFIISLLISIGILRVIFL